MIFSTPSLSLTFKSIPMNFLLNPFIPSKSRTDGLLLFQVFREILKKIVVQDSRNTGEQLGIDILFAEYLVHVAPAAREFTGKPSDTALLGFQSLFNEFPYRFHSEKILLTVPIRRFNITTKRGTEHSHRSLKVVGNPRYRYEIAAHARDAREPPCLTLYLVSKISYVFKLQDKHNASF